MSAWDPLAALWRQERATAGERFRAERAARPLKERVERGLALAELTIVDLAPSPGGRFKLWLQGESDLDDLRLGAGDPVRLWRAAPDEPEAVSAVLAGRSADKLSVVVDELIEEGTWNLDAEAPATTFDRGDQAIARFAGAKPGSDAARLAAVLLGERPAAREAERELVAFDAALNEPQRAAVRAALAARDVALVHGPPGTGKTRTLVEIVRQLLAAGERVLCTAASNAAVDHLAGELIAAGVDVLRLGHPARVEEELVEHTLDARLERHDTARLARGWLNQARDLRRKSRAKRDRRDWEAARALDAEARELTADARRQLRLAEDGLVSGVRVVAMTAAGSLPYSLADTAFDSVVLDEATQAVDPLALAAMGRGRRAILAGDPCQLPPTVIDPEAARAGLGSTFFERLAARDHASVRLLTVQHRMHTQIMAFPSESMYAGRLVAAPSVAAHRLEDLGVAADPLRDAPLVFVDTAGRGWSEERTGEDASTGNPGQAERTAAEARRLLSRGVAPTDLAVITPYDAQVRRLRELLAAERAAGLEIGSVDGFQGREKEAVVIDLVRSNDDGVIGFLADTRRMNVALTRARRFLLVVGDSATLGGHAYYRAWMAAVERHCLYVSAWSDEAEPLA